MATGFTEDQRHRIGARNNGRCEICDKRPSTDVHHRQPRGMGGATRKNAHIVNSPANALALCRKCHEWVERNRDEAREKGYLISRYANPLEQPVMYPTLFGRQWVILTLDYTVRHP